MEFLLDNIFYVAVALVSGSMLIWPLLRPQAGCPTISTLDATMRINKQDAAVIDVRSAESYAEGHLPRARHMPVKELADRLGDRKSTRLNSSHVKISYAVFCLKKKNSIFL